MEPNSSYVSYTNSSSQSFLHDAAEEEKKRSVSYNKGAAPSFHSSLHAVRRKLPAKPTMKKPIAPLPPTKPKHYKVDPSNFKDLVQSLTAAPQFLRRRLHQMAPPRLDLSTTTRLTHHLHPHSDDALVVGRPQLMPEVIPFERESHKFSETCGAALSPPGFSFSPSAMAWPFSPLLTPRTLSSLELSTVL